MKDIVYAVASMGGLGLGFGILLAWVSKKFHVEVDPRISKITDLLPGINCGACGLAGCASFAEGIVKNEAEITSCVACSAENRRAIAEVLGMDHEGVEQKVGLVATVHCHGGIRAKDRFEYKGLSDCRTAVLGMGGPKECKYACVGLGTCVEACPFDAIKINKDNLAEIDTQKCVGCKKCVAVCPRNIISMVSRDKKVYIKCGSHDKGPQVVKICKAGCISCLKCVKECPVEAITMVDNLPQIDYEKCINCMKCV